MTFIRHSSRKPSQKHHVYYPQLEQQSQIRKKPIDQRKPNIDSFYISGFIHQEQNQVFTSKISRELRGKNDIVASTRKEGNRTKPRRNDSTSLMKLSPYLHKKSPVVRKNELRVRSRMIDKYFVTVRNEMEASIIIQLFWRRILALRRFHYMADRKNAAITVQAAFRGFLARVRVKEYLKKMDFYVCLTQARLRRRLVTKRWNRSLDIMQSSAIFIQRNIRKFLAKCSLQNCAIDNAAIMIQMSYRRSVLRKKCYCRKRCNAAVKIQRVVRRIQARQKVNLFRKELNEASRNIQRCWRGYKARKMRNEVLLHRCLTEFRNRIKVLDSKIDCFENQLEKFLTKSHPGKIQSDFDRSQQNINRMKTQVESHERSIVELEWSKSLMNPNENDIDWGEEIDERIFQERQMKTSLQLDLMFNMKRNLYAYRRELDRINRRKQLFEDRINELRDERHALRERLQYYQRQESKRYANINYRKAIADEKRKWKIVSIKSRGKSMKKCNDATHMIESSSGSGHVDLDISNPQMKIVEHIEHNLFVAETQICSAMFEPLDKFQKYHL